MATANTSAPNNSTTTANDDEWYQGDNAQNLMLTLLNMANAANQPGPVDTSGASGSLVSALQGSMPAGMDFSAYNPLLSVIGDTSFSRENAIADSQGFINQIFREYENSSLPTIYKNPRATGIFNDTSTQLLANDAYSSAVAKGQSQLVNNITQYAAARQDQLGPVLALLTAQTSNANALTSAQVQQNSLIANATQSGINATQNAPQKPNTDVTDAAAILGSLYGIYQDYNANNTKNPVGQDSSATLSSTNNAVVNSDPYADNLDDELYYN
jgi:hypothetical protein